MSIKIVLSRPIIHCLSVIVDNLSNGLEHIGQWIGTHRTMDWNSFDNGLEHIKL